MKLSLKSTVNKPTPRVSRLTSPLKEYAASCHQSIVTTGNQDWTGILAHCSPVLKIELRHGKH